MLIALEAAVTSNDEWYGLTIGDPYPKKLNLNLNGMHVQQIIFGSYHIFVLGLDQTLQAFGLDYGQLGVEGEGSPKVNLMGKVVMAACGKCHSMALLKDGSVYSWGANGAGQLGLGHFERAGVTKISSFEKKVIQIGCGENFSMVLTDDGMLYSWGEYDKLGNLFTTNQCCPQRVAGISNIVQFRCGSDHVLALSRDGDLYSWGKNEEGQLGIRNRTNQTKPTKVTDIPSDVIEISCGTHHSMALLRNGSLYCWGGNRLGQLGLKGTARQLIPTKMNDIPEAVEHIRCGFYYSMAIAGNNLYWWGDVNKTGAIPSVMKFTKKVFFERRIYDVISCWPQSHYLFSIQTQILVEEMVAILETYSIPKDTCTYFIQIFLQFM